MNRRGGALYYLALSVLAGAIALAVSWLGPTENGEVGPTERFVVGGIFIACCTLGASLALRPNWMRGGGSHGSPRPEGVDGDPHSRRREGHHPDCDRFERHRFAIGGRGRCAGCSGLALGSVISIACMSVYALVPDILTAASPLALVAIGLVLILTAFAESAAPTRSTVIHFVSNAALVLGFSIITIGMLEATGDVVFGLIAIALSVLWLETRVQLSNWLHARTCTACGEPCRVYV